MRLALCPINPTIGDLAGNCALIARGIEGARGAGADLVLFPELAVCGYPPRDLLMREGFVAACAAAAKELGETKTAGLTVVFGVPLPAEATASDRGPAGVANSLVVYRDNTFVDYYDKRLLPTYDVFDEDRYFEPGSRAVVVDVPGTGGTGGAREVTRVGLSICEDLWKGEDAGFALRYRAAKDPVAELMAAGAQVIVSPSASPFVLGKGEKHRGILSRHAARHGVVVASLNQLGGNDELVFDGHTLVYGAGGGLLGAGRAFSGKMLVVDVARGAGPTGAAVGETVGAAEEDLFEALVLGIRDYLRKTGFRASLVGLSGGIDSALTACLAVAALGSGNVAGVSMPGEYSSEHSKSDAYELAKRLGIACQTIPIGGPFEAFSGALDAAFIERGVTRLGERMPDLTEENLQSRIRGTILMGLSNRTGAMVLTTGNKSELAVGYCTLYGDMNGGLAVLSDVSKQQVYALSRWINANAARCGFVGGGGNPPIPEGSITKAPSAELRPNQTDQDSLPPYAVLDEIIERYIERHESAARIKQETGFDAATVSRVVRMIDLAEYKRRQVAVGLKVTSVAFGSGRRMPIAQGWRG